MGLEMIEIIKYIRNLINFKGLNMRIGIHTVLNYIDKRVNSMGVLLELILFAMIFLVQMQSLLIRWNQMENKLEYQKVMISYQVMVSQDTKDLIDNHFPGEYIFRWSKEVDVPVAKRKVNGYFVTKGVN